MHSIERADALRFHERLQLLFDFGNSLSIQKLTQIGIAKQVTQLILIDRQRLSASLSQWRITVIDVIRDIAEEQ